MEEIIVLLSATKFTANVNDFIGESVSRKGDSIRSVETYVTF